MRYDVRVPLCVAVDEICCLACHSACPRRSCTRWSSANRLVGAAPRSEAFFVLGLGLLGWRTKARTWRYRLSERITVHSLILSFVNRSLIGVAPKDYTCPTLSFRA